jgi:UDP-N-acetylglucosamine 4,6-dehydratase
MRKTNVGGAENVVWAARQAGVAKVVALSSDKAFEPCNTYGKTKALAEDIFLSANRERGNHGPIFAVTRYGNVANSTGSVIPTWRARIAEGQAITVTSFECTRFWMTLPQAVALVMKTIDTMKGGELNIPDLPAYSIAGLVAAMGNPPAIVTGLGQGEKLHEGMAAGNTSDKARRMTVDELAEGLRHV